MPRTYYHFVNNDGTDTRMGCRPVAGWTNQQGKQDLKGYKRTITGADAQAGRKLLEEAFRRRLPWEGTPFA